VLFFDRVFADPELAPIFERVNKPRYIASVAKFVAGATGGRNRGPAATWKTRTDVSASHKSSSSVAGHLAAALDELDVPTEVASEVLTVVASLEPQIVN